MRRTGSREPRSGDGLEKAGLAAALGIGALVLVCCAALPLVAGVLGGVAIGAIVGVGAGVLALALLAALALLRGRSKRACRSHAAKESTA